MKIGIIIPCHNRTNYLKDCLWSLQRVKLPKDTVILLINDASTDQAAIDLFNNFNHPTALIQRDNLKTNEGIRNCLLYGYSTLFGYFECDLVINFDSDAVIKPSAVLNLISYYLPSTLLTGFHCTTKNANGTERHAILSETDLHYFKQSVGGINLCIDKTAYESYMRAALLKVGNFDHNACINAGGAYCLKESVVQHIGFESSMNHNEQPDVADDFYYYDLPQLTLIGIDNQVERLVKAKEKCTAFIKFGDVVLLHPPIYSKESYSEFCIRELYKHVNTSHMLIFQHDGFVNNWKAWDNDWLKYDYIGAPWHYTDGMAVGNGGFSLRSTKLMKILATDPEIKFTHPEDHHICRTYRAYLEKKHKIKFAPVEVAEKFSFEGYLQPHKRLEDQFGVHGMGRNTKPGYEPKIKVKEKLIPIQYQGLGDIIFLVPMIRALIEEGNEIVWPIIGHYMSIAKHFPDIRMVDMRTVPIDYNQINMVQTQFGKTIPYRFAMEKMGRNLMLCMQSKFELYGHDWKMWRQLNYKRFPAKEKELAELVGATGDYILVNRYFGEPARGAQISPVINSNLPVLEMSTIDGYSLIDWLGVVEKAKEVHTANTSILYLLELMSLPMPVYIYKRGTWGEQAFEHTRAIWENKSFIFQS